MAVWFVFWKGSTLKVSCVAICIQCEALETSVGQKGDGVMSGRGDNLDEAT